MQDATVVVLAIILGFTLLIVAALLSFSAINDAKRRGKSPVFVWVAAILFFPWGLIAWLLFRPDPIARRLALSPGDPATQF